MIWGLVGGPIRKSLLHILFCSALLSSFRSLLFSKERQNGSGSGWEGRGEEGGRAEGVKTVIRVYYVRKDSIFNNRKKRV